MSELRFLSPDEWETWREVRLRGLADEPDAFGSTLDWEQTYTEDDWRRRLASPSVVVVADGRSVATGAVFENRPGHAAVVAMWVDAAHRGQGLSRRILDALVGWATSAGLEVEIGVNQANRVARAAYVSYGFVPTGESYPLREGSSQRCDKMILDADRAGPAPVA